MANGAAAYDSSTESDGGGIKLSDIKGLATLAPFERKLSLAEAKNLRYFQFSVSGGTKVSLLLYTAAKGKSKLRLAARLSAKTEPTSKQAIENKALAALNGGYFNLSDGASAGYVIENGTVQADPTSNLALVQNLKLKPFLAQVFKRSELRMMKDPAGSFHYAIAAHDAPLPEGLELVDSLQGGPRLLPELTAAQEAFVRTETDGQETDSIGVKRTAARTAIGLCNEEQLMLVCVAGKKQDEFSAGITLADLAKLMSNLGAREALNFDGGTSTTMVLKGASLRSRKDYCMLVGREPETLVKSTLCLIEQK
jgi:hypothetical protein